MKKDKTGEILREISKKHKNEIKNNESFAQLLNKISQENDKKNDILKKLAEAGEANYKYSKDTMDYAIMLKSMVMNVDTRLSALDIAFRHVEEQNEKLLELTDNLQQQIDTMAYDLYENKGKKK
tara:strand:+ start:1391 stop:1762 length:372 start_codon:yes stop_codon:yes gene_type:complete